MSSQTLEVVPTPRFRAGFSGGVDAPLERGADQVADQVMPTEDLAQVTASSGEDGLVQAGRMCGGAMTRA